MKPTTIAAIARLLAKALRPVRVLVHEPHASWGTLNHTSGEQRLGIGSPADGFTIITKPPFEGRRLTAPHCTTNPVQPFHALPRRSDAERRADLKQYRDQVVGR